jgi:kynureninase
VNDLARHYTKFRVADRLLLTGHSHQAWPDVALGGQVEAFEDAALCVDDKWDRAFAKADRVRDGFRLFLDEPTAEIALGGNTHELVLRFLSSVDLPRRPRLVTSDGEFHTLRRQLARLEEAGVEVVRVPALPADTLVERIAAEVNPETCAVLVSAVLFETSRIVPYLGTLAEVCGRYEVELLVDAYHALGVVPFTTAAIPNAWVVGGGYKYLQLGEGNCVMRIPPHADTLRPVITGWFAEYTDLDAEHDPKRVAYGHGAVRFAGATYDPTSHYRAARVFDFFAEQGLTPARLREISLRQTTLLASLVDEIPEVTRDRAARTGFGGFLALRTPDAGRLRARLAERGVQTDSRGDHLRLGPAPYVSDTQLETAVGILGDLFR